MIYFPYCKMVSWKALGKMKMALLHDGPDSRPKNLKVDWVMSDMK